MAKKYIKVNCKGASGDRLCDVARWIDLEDGVNSMQDSDGIVRILMFDRAKGWNSTSAKEWTREKNYDIAPKDDQDIKDLILGAEPVTTVDSLDTWWVDDSNYKTHDYTRWATGKDEVTDDKIYKRCEMRIETKSKYSDIVVIEGFASTDDWDRDEEKILPTAFSDTLADFHEDGGLLLLNHEWRALPIGQVTVTEIKDKGLWVRAEVLLDMPMGRGAATLINRGILKTFSIGFRVADSTHDEETDRRIITKLVLYEISVVNIPSNRFARFGLSRDAIESVDTDQTMADTTRFAIKSFNILNKGVKEHQRQGTDRAQWYGGGHKTKDSTMTQAELEKIAEKYMKTAHQPYIDVLDEVKTSMQDMGDNIVKRKQIEKLLDDKVTEFRDGLVTADDVKTMIENVEKDLKEVNEKILKGNLGEGVRKSRLFFKDWQIDAGINCFDDEGKALEGDQLKFHQLFHAAVDYEKGEGNMLLTMRNLYDVVYLSHAYLSKSASYQGIRSLKSYQILHQMVEKYDPELAKAMAGTATGYGLEWLPTLMSSQIDDLYRLEPGLDSYIPTWQMPSATAEYPIKTGAATCYIASEPATDNPDELVKSEFATSKITFTAKDFAVAIPVSRNIIEDAIANMVAEVRTELVYALKEGFDDALINGDTTSTHMDASVTAANDRRKAFKGLRRLAKDASKEFDTQSTTAGVGNAAATFAELDVVYTAQLCGIMGVRPDEGMYVTGAQGYFGIMKMTTLSDVSKMGMPSAWATGKLPMFFGREIYVSGVVTENQAATGVYTDGTDAFTNLIHFNRKRGFRIGEKRGILIDTAMNVRTQQWDFVGTMRRDFQKMTPSTRYPVANGFNIA